MEAARLTWSPPGFSPVEESLTQLDCTVCGQECVDVGTDPIHCGGCGQQVGVGECVDGEPRCDTWAAKCGDTCVDLLSDPQHCGACDNPIGWGMVCLQGKRVCQMTNPWPPLLACGEECVSAVDATTCGTCERDCTRIGVTTCTRTCVGAVACTYDCRKEETARRACSQSCAPLACSTEVEVVAVYGCPGGGTTNQVVSCQAVPPETAKNALGETCAFQHVECPCG